MPRPKDWKGSDMRSRAEVVQWLHDHGSEVHDPIGLVVGRMRSDLGKGRALSQLLADMENDGMIKREVRGRRTMMLKLLDDWGLRSDLRTRPVVPAKVQAPGREIVLDGVDLEQLATTLLTLVIQRAHAVPSKGAELERLKEKVVRLEGQLGECRDAVILAREAEKEQRQQADTMRASLVKFQAAVDKPKKGTGGAPLREVLSAKDRSLLDRLMRELPSSR